MELLLNQGGLGTVLGGVLFSVGYSEGVSSEMAFGQRPKGRVAGKPGGWRAGGHGEDLGFDRDRRWQDSEQGDDTGFCVDSRL